MVTMQCPVRPTPMVTIQCPVRSMPMVTVQLPVRSRPLGKTWSMACGQQIHTILTLFSGVILLLPCFKSTETIRLIRDREKGRRGGEGGAGRDE